MILLLGDLLILLGKILGVLLLLLFSLCFAGVAVWAVHLIAGFWAAALLVGWIVFWVCYADARARRKASQSAQENPRNHVFVHSTARAGNATAETSATRETPSAHP